MKKILIVLIMLTNIFLGLNAEDKMLPPTNVSEKTESFSLFKEKTLPLPVVIKPEPTKPAPASPEITPVITPSKPTQVTPAKPTTVKPDAPKTITPIKAPTKIVLTAAQKDAINKQLISAKNKLKTINSQIAKEKDAKKKESLNKQQQAQIKLIANLQAKLK